ncbi:MAG: ABC transporter permease [Planctomycetia bacterium]|nr:ABC transporter permease [Planctomycetia bacterium]
MNDVVKSSAHSSSSWRKGLSRLAGHLGPLAALAVVVLSFAVVDYVRSGSDSKFITIDNARFIATQSVVVGMAALGMLLIIIAGGIDLSAGTALGLCAVVLATVLRDGHGIVVALIAALGVGAGTGFVNGVLITSLRVVPFIVTLGTMSVYLGVAKLIGDEMTVRPNFALIPDWLKSLVSLPDREWLIPSVLPNFVPGVWLFLASAAVLSVVLHRTVFGRYVFAVGSNEATARLCGVNVTAVKVAVYTLAGLFVGIAGVLQFARLKIGNPTSGRGLELQIIAAVVVGGASLSGGRGTVLGTIAGTVLMVVIATGGSIMGFRDSMQDIALGTIINAAAAVDQFRLRRLAGSA